MMQTSTWRGWNWLRTLALLVALCLAGIPYWPQWQWLMWLTLLVLYAPAWLYLTLFLPWCVGWQSIKLWQYLMLLPLVFVGVRLFDLKWPVAEPVQAANFVTLSANLGNMADSDNLARLLTQHNVAVALFQEASLEKLAALPAQQWQTQCEARLCIASRYPFEVERTLSRNIFQGYGNFAVFYQIQLPDSRLMMANVHFETPRPALESLIKLSPDSMGMLRRQQDRELQATIISEWVQSESGPVIVAGDLNMPVLSPIYQRFFSTLGNALSEKPQQLVRYTKYTRWHGIRIDHQLYRGGLAPLSARVLQLNSGDHRPVLVKWRI